MTLTTVAVIAATNGEAGYLRERRRAANRAAAAENYHGLIFKQHEERLMWDWDQQSMGEKIDCARRGDLRLGIDFLY